MVEDIIPRKCRERKRKAEQRGCSSWPCRIFSVAGVTKGLFQPPRFYRDAVHHHRRRLVKLIILTASLVIIISQRKVWARGANWKRRNAIHPVYA